MTVEPRPLLTEDPARVGSYRVTGRLGEGGQGVVYLGESAGGERVAIKVLAHALDEEARADFAQEAQLARRVQAFCTASVLAGGELDGGVPYVISEFVDGPSLARVLAERGPLSGPELRRLAIGSLTALAAIHQAGVVHRDFKPANVLLGRDGPRVIDFGISRTLDAAEPDGEHLTGTPPYMAPEQFGSGAGAPADLFAWAATVVCAATGSPPFGSGDLPALVNRILRAEPDLGDLHGDLREVVSACLAKDPAARPTARAALLRLLGHRVEPQRLLDEGTRSAAPESLPDTAPESSPGRSRRRRALTAGAGAVVLAGATIAVVLGIGNTPDDPVPPTSQRISSGPMNTASTTTSTLPGTEIELHENPADPTWASSYYGGFAEADFPAYVRDPRTRTFQRFGSFQLPVVSPGGRYVAALPVSNLGATDHNTLRLVDRGTGEDITLRTADSPGITLDPAWSGDGRRLLMTLRQSQDDQRTIGFVIVDAAARSVQTRRTGFGGEAGYAWGADGSTLITQGADGAIRYVGLDGRELGTFAGKGALIRAGVAVTTAGTVFATTCREGARDVCLWDAATGARKAVIPLAEGTVFNGWLDRRHFLATVTGGETGRLALAGLDGETVRVLVEGPAEQMNEISVWFTPR
ncbi:WD40 repeat domain-containing serine/threonine protein kinase [Nonomuraea sp. NPDC048826]|uniref:WD40 repeat domain-containing serine/threonine protein kinase n=1 Tax=Nonomuraea sp. NPDC048826 TaxID=3364347 RepID=UPI0037177615